MDTRDLLKNTFTTNRHEQTRTKKRYENMGSCSSCSSCGSWLKILVLILAVFLTGLSPTWAQSSGYYVELRFVQRLSWTTDKYAMRYEVLIEKEQGGRYVRSMQEYTEANFIEVSLSPGKYRFQVVPHDFLDQPITVTEWVAFEVRPGEDQLASGEHEMVMVNPGDESSRKEIMLTAPEADKKTEYINQFDLYLGAAFVPLFPIYGENEFFNKNVSPVGIAARFCAVSVKNNILNPGLELAAAWRIYGGGDQAVHSTDFDINALAQARFPGGKTALNLRAGAGISLLPITKPAAPDGQYSIHVNIGASFLWLFTKNLYLEAGADYSQFFTEDNFGFVRPWIGVGYRF